MFCTKIYMLKYSEFLNPRYIQKIAFSYEFEFTQYKINWQQQANYKICISVNRNCNVSCWRRFLPTLNCTEIIKGLNYNRSRENISLLKERMILLKFIFADTQNLYERKWFMNGFLHTHTHIHTNTHTHTHTHTHLQV